MFVYVRDSDGLQLVVDSREGDKWMDSAENGICGFVPHKKCVCAGNTDLRVLGINMTIDAVGVD